MMWKLVFVLFFISDFSFGAFIFGHDNNFEDLFKTFDAANWRKDYGIRHCGSQSPGGCVWTKRDNVNHIKHDSVKSEPWKDNEVRISVRNDCEGDFCCSSDSQCTSYTSGQITSRNHFGYGSFSFMMRIGKESKAFEIESESFKSVYCARSPSSDMFPKVLRMPSTMGYCDIDSADLSKYSSNQDLCHSRVAVASKRNICARYTWVIRNFAPSSFHFKANGKSIDYENTAIYVGDEFVADGGRDLIQDFEIKLKETGMHKVEVFGFEDCCAGNYRQAYTGWLIERSNYVPFEASEDSDTLKDSDGESSLASPPGSPKDKQNAEAVQSESHVERSSVNIEGMTLDESNRKSTSHQPMFTTRESETTTEATYCSGPSCSQWESNPGSSNDVASSSRDVGGISYHGPLSAHPDFRRGCPLQCITVRMMLTTTDIPIDPTIPTIGREAYPVSESMDCSSCSEADSEIILTGITRLDMLNAFEGMVELLFEAFEDEAQEEEIITHIVMLSRSIHDLIIAFMLEEDLLPPNPENRALVSTIQHIQSMVQEALERTQQHQDENGTLPDEVIEDLMTVYGGLVHIESLLDDSDEGDDMRTATPDYSSSDISSVDHDREVPDISSVDDDPPPSYPEESPNLNQTGLRNEPFYEQFHTTTEQIATTTSDPGDDAAGSPFDNDYAALLCFNLQRMVKNFGNAVSEKIGMCLSNLNSQRAVLFAGAGQVVFKKVVNLPFDVAKKAGRFRVDWLPDSITWNADNQRIGSISAEHLTIPGGLMHLKFYAAPQNPRQVPQNLLVEQTLQLFSVGYQEHISKDELRFTLDEPENGWHAHLLIGSMMFCTFGLIMLRCKTMKTDIPMGYKVLGERDEMI